MEVQGAHGLQGPDVSFPYCALHRCVAWYSPQRNDLQPYKEQDSASHPLSQTTGKGGRVPGSVGGSQMRCFHPSTGSHLKSRASNMYLSSPRYESGTALGPGIMLNIALLSYSQMGVGDDTQSK